MLRIPLELIYLTIDHLHQDISTLKSFALASRSCLHGCRPHLFRSVQIDLGNQTQLGFAAFLAMIPVVAKYVRYLAILQGYQKAG